RLAEPDRKPNARPFSRAATNMVPKPYMELGHIGRTLPALTINAPRQKLRPYALAHRCSRLYHSHDYAHPTPPFNPTESAILSAGLSHVPAHGFTARSLNLGAQDAGYLSVSTNLFPSGAFALVEYHLVTQRLALPNHFQRPAISPSTNAPPENIPENIRSVALRRLRANVPIAHRYDEALALLSLPANISTGVRELARLADEILYLAGSTTVTTAWYTDRAALAGIYASAEVYMTQDKSEGFIETEEFLRSRLEEGERLRGGVGMLGKWMGMQMGGLLDGLRSKGVWI
ncbi:MAG: hypothetical protein Q9163_004531, partial [Psora crenata]